ncbi:MAG: TolC family protein [Sandaracinaceae bacterium]|nr:TolC family protein [Sandaracinaceae bacterium]
MGGLVQLIWGTCALAQWSMEEALERAVERAPEVQRARAELAIAEAYREFGRIPWVANPTLSLRAMLGVPDDRAAIYGIFLGIPIDFSGRQGLREREAEEMVAAADARLEAARNDAKAAALVAYIDVAIADVRFELRQARLRLAEELLARTQALLKVGASTLLEHALVEAEVGQARAASAEGARLAWEARARFRNVLDLDAEEVVTVEALAPPEAPPGDLQAWLRRARERRAEPRHFSALRRRLRLTESRLFAERIDPLLFGAEWETQGNVQSAHTFGFSLNWSFPILWTAQGDRAVARGEENAASVNEGLALRGVEREVVEAAGRLENSLRALKALQEEAIPAMERALAGAMELLENGATDIFHVLLTQKQLFEIRERAIDAMSEAWKAKAALWRAIGGFDE